MAGWTGNGTAPAENAGVLITGEETGGRFALIQTVEVRGEEPPRHRHEREDEILHVLDGALRVWIAGSWSRPRRARRSSCPAASSTASSSLRGGRGC